ncbi:7-cyano-7-deazaguanine synthase [Candidatus Falkowbacteria bacterium]|nr:7-cyano-7-deazaguanine synthase [Candidatus Falkowbacteria bacterium]
MERLGQINNKIITGDFIKINDQYFSDLKIDSLVKIALLTTISGYLKKNKIIINTKFKLPNKKSLEQFLSFLLNDRNFCPINYNLKIKEKLKKDESSINIQHNFQSIILFSGGFDSSSALLYSLKKGWKPLLLWIGFGQKNEKQEEKIVKKLAKRFQQKLLIIKLDLKELVDKGWKEWDYIVPARNFVFAAFAAAILSHSKFNKTNIIIGVHEEEFNHPNPGPDKSPHFFAYCTKLFSKYYKKQIRLITPFKNISKTDLVAYWQNTWEKKYKLDPHETISCYYGNNCGKCNACFKRSISFMAANIGLDKNIKINPFSNNAEHVREYLKRCFSKSKKSKFNNKRAIETLLAYKNAYKLLPTDSKNIMDNLSKSWQSKIIRKEKELKNFRKLC